MLKKILPVHILLCLLFCLLLVLAYLSEGTIESGDSYQHYLMAKYSFQHPEILLDLWGKPIFTLLAAPFAQFGFFGVQVFNIVCTVLTAWFAYLIAGRMKLHLPLLAVFFVVFAPMYFVSSISALTEPLFGLMMMSSLYLAMSGRAVWAALIISFLPFVRSEGYPVIILFFIVLAGRRQWKALPLLASGTLIYSVIGHFYFGDIKWLINMNPYSNAADVYGYGDPLHFVYNFPDVMGHVLSALLVVGLIAIAWRLLMMRKKDPGSFFFEELVIIAGTCVGYVLMHSLVLWKGLGMGSMGTLRVLAAIMPFAGLLALRGFDALASVVSYHKVVVFPSVIIMLFFVWRAPFKYHQIPVPHYGEEIQLAECAGWVKEKKLTDRKIVYFYPFLAYALDIDPFDYEKRGVLNDVGLNTEPGSIILWDSHFGPAECGLPVERMMSDTTLRLLKRCRVEWKDWQGKPVHFEVLAFEKK